VPNISTQKRGFKMDPALLYSVISSQAGTPAKALLELVMNSIDAAGDKVDVTISQDGFEVVDGGKGFSDMSEIENFFETFGTPHKEGDATYGKFRMGRGQIFAFSENTWHTGEFKMSVDIKNKGLEYDLSATPDDTFQGCSIKGNWYDRLSLSDFHALQRELNELIAYAPVPVTVNGKQINRIPENEKWGIETDNAYINIRGSGPLKVYNQGVMVREYPNYQFGVGGVVVSKVPLEVNFARNDILQSKCLIWKEIKPVLRREGDKLLDKKTTRMSDEQRFSLAQRILEQEIVFDDAIDLKVITTSQGKQFTILQFLTNKNKVITLSPSKGNQIADILQQRGLALCIAPETLDRFGVNSLDELVDVLENLSRRRYRASNIFHDTRKKIVPFENISASINSKYAILKDKELKPVDRAALSALRRSVKNIPFYVSRVSGVEANERKIVIGSSECARGWTDGSTYIAIHKDELMELRQGFFGAQKLVQLLVHEYIHNSNSQCSHVHDLEFYEVFHNTLLDTDVNYITQEVLKGFSRELERKNIKLPVYFVRSMDAEDRLVSLSESVVDNQTEDLALEV